MKKLTILLMFLALLIIPSRGYAAICDDTDALKIVQETIMHASQAGADGAQKIQPIQDIYKNKWLISCAIANGITNLDKAGDYLMQPDTVAAYQGLVQGGEVASQNITALGAAMKKIAQSPSFQHSVVDRTRVIGMYILLLSFLIGIAAKLYALILGADNTDPIDFALIFIRFITILMFITFMKPLAFYGMQISSIVSNMLLDAPIQIIVSSNVGYTGSGSINEGSSSSTPWFSSPLTVTSRYGKLRDIEETGRLQPHYGIDFAAPMGTRLTAPYTGTATCRHMGGYGLAIDVIPADNPNEIHRVGHLSECRFEGDPELAKDFKNGKSIPVAAGQGIGLTGNSGRSTGPHVHVEVRVGGSPKDPALVYAVRSGAASPTSQAAQPGTGNPLASSGTQAGTNAVGTYSYEGNDSLTTDALFQEIMRLKSSYLNAKDSLSLWDFITGGFQYLCTYIIATVAKWMAGAVLSVLIILADVMMAITLALGPIVAGLTLIPVFENYLQNWIKGYITFLFYQPLAACFTVLSFVIMVVSLDTGISGYLILVTCYVMGCMKIPEIADGLSTSALVGVAMMMAFAPAMLVAKVAGLAVGAVAGGPAGAAVANAVVNTAGNAAGAVLGGATGGEGGGGGGQSTPKASSGGKSGFVKTKALLAAVILGTILISAPAFAAMSQQEKKDLMDMSKVVRYPSPAMVNAVLSAVSNGGLPASPGGMIDIGDSGVKVYNDGDDDNDVNGIYNTAYCDAVDMPMTRFVLGKAVVDGGMIYEMAFTSSYNKKLDDGTARELNTFLLENGFLGNMNKVYGIIGRLSTSVSGALSSIGQDADQLKAEIRAKGDVVTAFLYEAQQAIITKLMFWVPMYILILMFFIQLGVISYLKIVEPTIGEKASYISIVPRFIFYALMIYFLKDAVAVCITFSNYISNAIVPIELQRNLMENITSKTGGLISGYSLSGFMVTVFRLLTYFSIKILLMARDMFMTITVIVGPTCIALGFFTRYRNPDQIHQFFTGWIENFVKLLFWGPLAAIMLFCLGILSVLTAMDMLSVISVAVTAMAFLYAAGNIPNMAEKMSSVALGGLLTAMAPFIMNGMSMAVRGGTSGVFMLTNLLYGAGKTGAPYSVFSHWWNNAGDRGAGGGGAGAGAWGGGSNAGGPNAGGGNGKPTVKASSSPFGISKDKNGTDINMPNKKPASGFLNSLANVLAPGLFPKIKGINGQDIDLNLIGKDNGVKSQTFHNPDAAGANGPAGNKIAQNILDILNRTPSLKLAGNIKGTDGQEIIRHAEKLASACGSDDILNAFVSGKTKLSELLLGNGKNSLINSAPFKERTGLADQTEGNKAAVLGMMGLKMAQTALERKKGMLAPSEYAKMSAALKNTSAEMENFVKAYASGAFRQMPEEKIAGNALSIAKNGLINFEDLYKNAIDTPRPLFTRGKMEGLPSMFEHKDFGVTKKDIKNTVDKINDKIDAAKLSDMIKRGEYKTKDLFVGSDGTNGLINHEAFMIGSGLAAEPPSVRAAMTGLLGIKTVLSEMAAIKGKVRPEQHYKTSEVLKLTENKLENFIKTYTAGGFKDIKEDELIPDVMSVTSEALGSFDILMEQVFRDMTAANKQGAGHIRASLTSDPVSFIPRNIVSSIPEPAQRWLTDNMRGEGGARMADDIINNTVRADAVFGAPLGSEELRSVCDRYGITPPANAAEDTAFKAFGLGVMREAASRANSPETVERIDRSIRSVSNIIRTGGIPDNTAAGTAYDRQPDMRIADPVAYAAMAASEYYSEQSGTFDRSTLSADIYGGRAADPISFIPRDIVSVIPEPAQRWLTDNMRGEGGARMADDIINNTVRADAVFGAPLGSEELRSVCDTYGITPPANAAEDTAFKAFGLGVMREAASRANSPETVERIDRSISGIGDIIRTGGPSDDPVIDPIYGEPDNICMSDPVAYETKAAAEYYSEQARVFSGNTAAGNTGAADMGYGRTDPSEPDHRRMDGENYDGYGYRQSDTYSETQYEGRYDGTDGVGPDYQGKGEPAERSGAGVPEKGKKPASRLNMAWGKKMMTDLDSIVKESIAYQNEIYNEIHSGRGGDSLSIKDNDD